MNKHSIVLSSVLGCASTAVVAFAPGQAAAATAPPAPAARELEIVVDGGVQPARITVAEGERVRLKFVRRDHSPCTREVVFASLDIRRELPVDPPVVIELPPLAAGEVEFKCGMHMIRGVIEVQAREP